MPYLLFLYLRTLKAGPLIQAPALQRVPATYPLMASSAPMAIPSLLALKFNNTEENKNTKG